MDRVRDMGLDSYVKRAHSHRERLIVECTEPYILGSNILLDPGFERSAGGGPNGGSIPSDMGIGSAIGCPHGLQWPDKNDANETNHTCVAGSDFPAWMNMDSDASDGTENEWKIATANPRSGTNHARWTDAGGNFPLIGPWGLRDCIGGGGYPWGARTDPGDLVTFSIYIEVSTTTGLTTWTLFLDYYDSDGLIGGFISSQSDTGSVSTTYAQASVSGVVPTGTVYVRPSLDTNHSASFPVSATVDLDDGILSVA